MPTLEILVAGCGYVGSRLARRLLASGARVHTLRRGGGGGVPGAASIRGDLEVPGSLRALPAELDGAVFAASPSELDERGYRRIFVDGLGNLIRALDGRMRSGARLVFTSSTAVYAQSEGEWVDETSPTEPTGFNGRVLLEAEGLLRDAPLAGCALRLGGIYGPGRTRRIDQVREGRARLAPGPPHFTNRIHRDDAAGAIAHLLAAEHTEETYVGVDGEPADDNDVLRFLAAELGIPEPPFAAAAPPRRGGSKRCRNRRLVNAGYRFEYPGFRAGYRALLAAERAAGDQNV
jgi:nucleoside-diphosphate-sugar epimerase